MTEEQMKNEGTQETQENQEVTATQQSTDEAAQNAGSGANQPAGKTYTQSQLNSFLANEKRTARQAVLKELGFTVADDKTYKDTIKSIKSTLDAGKTQQQLDQEARKAAESQLTAAEARAALAEMKYAALAAGVTPDSVEDVITLAAAKVNETTTLDQVLKEMKTKYPSFFNSSAGAQGTGGSANPARKPGAGGESLGQRLAKSHKTSTKSSYFNN